MSTFDEELLGAADSLLSRRVGQRGRLSTARIRRSVSTSYYALFHFMLEEIGTRVVGTHNDLRSRRRILIRTISHKALKLTLDKVRGKKADASIAEFVKPRRSAEASVDTPAFVRTLAQTFIDAQTKRHDADYDLNVSLSESDARLLSDQVKGSIETWRKADSSTDQDFKHALCILVVLKGQLRADT